MISTKPRASAGNFLSNYTSGRDNNFTLLRFVAATCVLITHSFILSTGRPETEPLGELLGISLGTIAVHVFFVASGFLVTGSLLYRQSLRDFVVARFLRIYPGLWVALAVTVLVVGLFFTNLAIGTFLHHPETLHYLARNATLHRSIASTLPGAFGDVPYKDAVNGSLWTLPLEVRMYAMLAGLWLMAKLAKVRNVSFFSATCIVLAFFGIGGDLILFFQHKSSDFTNLGGMFFAGASLRVLQNRVPASPRLAWTLLGVLLAAAIFDRMVFGVIYRLTVPYLVMYFALVPGGFIRRFNALGDYSYGIYIYAFPVQQAVAYLWRGVQPYEMMMLSFLVTLFLSVASWHLIESRALGFKERLMKMRVPAA